MVVVKIIFSFDHSISWLGGLLQHAFRTLQLALVFLYLNFPSLLLTPSPFLDNRACCYLLLPTPIQPLNLSLKYFKYLEENMQKYNQEVNKENLL